MSFAGAVGGSLLQKELMNGAAVFGDVQQLVGFAVKRAEGVRFPSNLLHNSSMKAVFLWRLCFGS